MDCEWKERPKLLEYWPDDVDILLGLDENGSSDINPIKNKIKSGKEIAFEERYFNLAGVIFNKPIYDELKAKINDIKYTYWEEGMCDYHGIKKRVCFHSSEIRRKKYPFNVISNYEDFLEKISFMVDTIPAKVISCFIDKEKHCRKYKTPIHPYHIAITFILERFCRGLNKSNKKAFVILESRGKREDMFVLKHIVELIERGTSQNPANHFKNILGVYFNPKWWVADDCKKSFVILEFADLIAYPIFDYARKECVEKKTPFLIVEKKLYKFPYYNGWGLKIFP